MSPHRRAHADGLCGTAGRCTRPGASVAAAQIILLAATGGNASWPLAADGLQEVHHELVDPLGGVGLHPVAGLSDPLDPHLRDPGPVRRGQFPA
jgi:hypothetical protein